MLKTPVFRRSVRTTAGSWEKSTSDPMKYSAYAFYLNRIGSDLGSEDKWTLYCMRRGNANALLKVAPNPEDFSEDGVLDEGKGLIATHD
ncbi:hypothetical protein MY1884_009570 [Beauveria asiatica]